jgi:hypothetical protein
MSSQTELEELFPVSRADYGEGYSADLLTVYQDYVASAHAISDKRHSANTFFLTANTAFLGVTGYLSGEQQGLLWLAALAAFFFSFAWLALIKSYARVNQSKFAVIARIESKLPVSPYTAEWAEMQRGQQHQPLTRMELWVPRIFMLMHLAVFSFGLMTWLGV